MDYKTTEPSYTDHTSIIAAARTVRNQLSDGKPKGSDIMKRTKKLGPMRNERGVALLVALAVLVLMAIMAVSFYSSQDIESMAAANARAQRSAEAVAEGGLEWAIALIESDVQGNGVVLGYDTEYDIWGALAKDSSAGYNPDVLLDGTDVDLSDLDNPDVKDSRWITVRTPDHVVGRMAILIEDENGKANVNVAGTKGDLAKTNNTGDGLSPAELSLQTILGAISGGNSAWADAMIRTRNGGDDVIGTGGDDDSDGSLGFLFCDDDLDGVVDNSGEGLGEPDERNLYALAGDDIALLDLTTAFKDFAGTADQKRAWLGAIRAYISVSSRTQNVYKLTPADDTSNWAEQVCVNTADAGTIRGKLSDLQTAGRLPATADLDQVAANIVDFIDADSTPTSLGGKYGIEKTPYVNEVEAKPKTYQITVGTDTVEVHDHGEFIELINPYDVDVDVTIITHMQGPSPGCLPQPVTYTAHVLARPDDSNARYYVIGDTHGHYTDPVSTQELERTGNLPAGCDQYENLDLDSSRPIKLEVSGTTYEAADFGDEGAEDSQTRQKDDPRVETADNWATAGDTMGKKNSTYRPDNSGDKDGDIDLSKLFVVYNGKVGAVGHLGRVHAGAKWATINLSGDDVGNWDAVHTEPTWLNIYDVFTTQDPVGNATYGLININTAPKEVLLGLKGVDGTRADAIIGNVTDTARFESIAELGGYLDMATGDTSWDREKHLADVAGLVTVRSNVFRVTVLAQAVDRQGNAIGERKIEASVLRTIDVGNGKPSVRVLSMRWLVEE